MRTPVWIGIVCTSCLLGVIQLALPSASLAGSFHVRCTLAARLQDDPIVHPNHAGMSHWHDFYGSRAARATATYGTMVAARTTCTDRLDTAGYWHPRTQFRGHIRRGRLFAYYSRAGKPTVRPFPKNLRVIAGNSTATTPQTKRVIYWRCVDRGSRKRSRYVPRCRAGERLSVTIVFPDCWNGTELDSTNHKSHMQYSRKGRCPASHSRPLPRLTMTIVWPFRARNAQEVTLSSGNAYSMHADFWNTWSQRRLRSLTNQCLNLNVDCGLIVRSRRP